jgi:type II secretory pathway pseudopilin PulG
MKIKAFTIAELLVVLVISSLIISMSFWGLSIFKQYFAKSAEAYNFLQNKVLIEQTIRQNILQSTAFSTRGQKLVLVDSKHDSISYFIANDTFYFMATNGTITPMTNQKAELSLVNDSVQLAIGEQTIIQMALKNTAAHSINKLLQ